jgi:hypothetical protein
MSATRPLGVVLLVLLSCQRDTTGKTPKQSDPYTAALEQFHKAPPATLEQARLLLGSKGQCSRETLEVVCEWSVPAPTTTKRIQVACDDDTATSVVRYAVFPDEMGVASPYVPVAKCTCAGMGDPLCAEIRSVTCVP